MFDLMEEGKDFAVVFDYVCDIEVHFKNGYEFYQIKTHGNNASSYTSKSLTSRPTNNSEGSILGKLYKLNKLGYEGIKLALVTNIPYSCKRERIVDETTCMDSFPDKDHLVDALSQELDISNVDLTKVYYLYTSINLQNPENEIQGKIVISFEKIKHCEPINPRALYRLIYDTVSEKACYEFSANDYESLIQNKGITKEEFDRILECHAVNEKTGIKQTQQYIESLSNISTRRQYKNALAKLLQILPTSKTLQQLEKQIGQFLQAQDTLGSIESTIDLLTDAFHDAFPMEYNNSEKIVFYIVSIFKYEEGVYDNENDL